MSQIRSRTLLGMPAPNFAAEPFNLTRRAPRRRRKVAPCVRIHRDCTPPRPATPHRAVDAAALLGRWNHLLANGHARHPGARMNRQLHDFDRELAFDWFRVHDRRLRQRRRIKLTMMAGSLLIMFGALAYFAL